MDANYLKSELSDQELMLVNSEVEKNSKNAVVAYLLWWFTGFMGGHRYYFGRFCYCNDINLLVINMGSWPWCINNRDLGIG